MRFPVAYLAGYFPLRSETFVYREVRELRARGWNVIAVSLNSLRDQHEESLADLQKDRIFVYEPGWSFEAIIEMIAHPICSARTLFKAVGDVLNPREPTGGRDRIKTIGQALAGLKLASDLRKLGVKHIHCHFAHAPASVGMYASTQLGIPFSFTGHANDLFQRRHLLRKKLLRAGFIACISNWHREFYRAIEPSCDSRCEVIRCGVPVDQWMCRLPVPNETDALRVLTLCRLVEKKGVDMLIRALHAWGTKSARNWKLTVAGDGEMMDKLKEIAQHLAVSHCIDWRGAVTNEVVPQLLAESDVFALPCRTDVSGDKDGIPVVLMEAMACGTPVIAGNVAAISELVEDGKSGLLVDGTNLDAIVNAIDKLDRDPELRKHLASGGRQRVETEFSLARNVSKLEERFAH
jgi:glycosyltransferase involved in cell wall biosynthesis